jgi:orotidine-5'-phosphate decarboxylase
MMEIDLQSPVPVYLQVADWIKAGCLAGRWRPGDRIPPVREMAALLRINPNTVAKAVEAAASMGVWMVNVHASGGLKMMQAAREALTKFSQPPHLIAVTVLTSLTDDDLKDIGLNVTAEEQVQRLALLTKKAGLDGVVCSPREIKGLRETIGKDFLLVTPGIRPVGSAQNDQQRTLTPLQALDLGGNYLVIGRPITAAPDPVAALEEIIRSLN